jgi:Cft2 family RNA processing exonuclease
MDEIFQQFDGSIFLPEIELFLDSTKRKPFGYISHAHGDHIARHKKIICTPGTARILDVRLKKPDSISIPFFRKKKINSSTITLLPAGHILGSAQLFYESAEGSLLYSGDFRCKPSRTAESLTYQSSDVLIMETTFGSSLFRFPPRKEMEEKLLFLVREKLNSGITPVVFAYPLGKAQEVLHLLSHAKLPVAVDYTIIRYVHVYERLGVKFGKYEKFRRSEFKDKVLLLPALFRKNRYMDSISDKFTIFLSGWGMDPAAVKRFGVDVVLPYSDHADFDELLTYVDRVNPKRIYCTHGISDFVSILKEKGYQTKLLSEPNQQNLFY